MQKEKRLVPPKDLPFPTRKNLELRQERRCVYRPLEQRAPPRLLLVRRMAAVRAGGQALFDLVGRRAGLQLALDRTIRHREKADRRVARDVEKVVCHIVSLLVRYPSRREVLCGYEPARTRVERTAIGQQKDLVERVVQVGAATYNVISK